MPWPARAEWVHVLHRVQERPKSGTPTTRPRCVSFPPDFEASRSFMTFLITESRGGLYCQAPRADPSLPLPVVEQAQGR